MILDSTLTFDQAAPITVTRQSTNTIDLGVSRSIGSGGHSMRLAVLFPVLPTGPAGTTLNVQYQVSADNVTFETLAESGPVPVADFDSYGAPFKMSIPSGQGRYVAVNYVVGGGPLATGAVTASIAAAIDDQFAYPRNYVTQ